MAHTPKNPSTSDNKPDTHHHHHPFPVSLSETDERKKGKRPSLLFGININPPPLHPDQKLPKSLWYLSGLPRNLHPYRWGQIDPPSAGEYRRRCDGYFHHDGDGCGDGDYGEVAEERERRLRERREKREKREREREIVRERVKVPWWMRGLGVRVRVIDDRGEEGDNSGFTREGGKSGGQDEIEGKREKEDVDIRDEIGNGGGKDTAAASEEETIQKEAAAEEEADQVQGMIGGVSQGGVSREMIRELIREVLEGLKTKDEPDRAVERVEVGDGHEGNGIKCNGNDEATA